MIWGFENLYVSSNPIDLDDIDEEEQLKEVDTKGKWKCKQITIYWEHYTFLRLSNEQKPRIQYLWNEIDMSKRNWNYPLQSELISPG